MPEPDRPVTILIIEDKRELREVLRRSLSDSGFAVLTAADGDEGFTAAVDHRPGLIILDVGLPTRTGFEVARDLRAREVHAPILMLTAHATVADRLEGFESGADDYLSKPFNYDELLARVRALLRRSQGGAPLLRVGDLACDPVAHQITRDGTPLSLTRREYAVLEYLMRRAGTPVSRDEISRAVWSAPFDPENNVIDVYISYLRSKLQTTGGPELLHTVRRVGYVLTDRPPGSGRSGARRIDWDGGDDDDGPAGDG